MSSQDLFPDDDHGGTTGVATDPVSEGEDSMTGEGNGSGDNGGQEVGRPKTDRKRVFLNEEALEARKRAKGNAVEACKEMMKILLQRDIEPENEVEYEEYLRELHRNAAALRRLHEADRLKKFKRDRSGLQKEFLKVGDHPMFATQQSEKSSQVTAGDSKESEFGPDSLEMQNLELELSEDGPGVQEVEDEVPSQTLEALDLAYIRDVDEVMASGRKRKGRPPKPITDPNLKSLARQRQLKEFRKIVKQWSIRLGCSKPDDADGGLAGRNKLLGLCLNLDNSGPGATREAKEIASLGWKLFNGQPVMVTHTVDEEEAMWIIESLRLTERNYIELRLRLLGRLNLPPAYKVLVLKNDMRPPLDPIRHGWRASLATCLMLTIRDWLILWERQGKEVPERVLYSFNLGMDGSGDKKDYDHRGKKDYSTKNNFSVVFALLDIHDPATEDVIYTSATRGQNSPKNTRPLMEFPDQEGEDVNNEVIGYLNEELKELEGNAEEEIPKFDLDVTLPSGKKVVAELEEGGSHLRGIDGKMEADLGGMGGAPCTCCDVTEKELKDLAIIANGFLINKTIDDAHRIFEEVKVSEDSTKVRKRKGDKSRRKGLAHKPKTHKEVNAHCPVLHLKINMVSYVLCQLFPRQNSHQKHFFRGCGKGKISRADKEACKEAKEEVLRKVHEEFGFRLDASSLPKGRWLDILSPDYAAEKLAGMIHDESKREGFLEFWLKACVTARALNSQKNRIDEMELREIGIEAMLAFQRTFPWSHLSPTLHKALAHGWELVQWNKGKGLGKFAENGIEGQNKYIEYYKLHGSRKCSTELQYKDIWYRLWFYSSPRVQAFEREKGSRSKRVIVPDQVDAMVQSLFIGDCQPDEHGNESDEHTAGTMVDPNGQDDDEFVHQALIREIQENFEGYEDEPMEAD